jgi:uncharacterized protein YgbK (DUF1537 family)
MKWEGDYMIKLLIIADDFTGALDTGVQFAACGARTRVITEWQKDLTAVEQAEVLVIDAETRHLPAEQAAAIVGDVVVRAVRQKIPHIYKKTDSALRGNIGAELTAMMCASGEKILAFMPAFPQMDRTTVEGIHYIGDLPVAKSVFGQDPFEPVTESRVAAILAQQSEACIYSVPTDTDVQMREAGIYVFDAQTVQHLQSAGQQLARQGKLHILAGCAGFGAILPELLGLGTDTAGPKPALDPRLLVVCGSVNPITREQIDWASRNGFAHEHLTPEQKLREDYWDEPEGKATIDSLRELLAKRADRIIDSNDEDSNASTTTYAAQHGLGIDAIREGISRSIGRIVAQLFTSPDLGTLLITGGDTLLQCMRRMKVDEMEPICELASGVVLSRFSYNGCSRCVISKSGGFGSKTLLTDLKTTLEQEAGT